MKNGEEDRAPVPGSSTRSRTATDAGLKARQKVIGAGLKRLYDDVVDEPVPDEFKALLGQLENNGGGRDPSGGRS